MTECQLREPARRRLLPRKKVLLPICSLIKWNGHLAVEQASCLFHFPASWWNGHLSGMGILVEWAS
ncbi:hypothetical protein [Moorena sp. SIO2C4]|uniref:hypothetical protein n=1 Tax=Moorena sp. SIO2C4 TaxID=2607824 RepID=UPI0013C61CB2|nr:hypothetical protein [Moorena sp. SIO2C4]NES46570.1 hypothetical protein [Moorena sp. SIO2C4]